MDKTMDEIKIAEANAQSPPAGRAGGQVGTSQNGAGVRISAWDKQTIPKGAHGWIQWKGTDVCLDIHCECGEHSHFDGDFCYYIECPDCHRIYFCNGHIELIAIDDKAKKDIGEFQPKHAKA